MEIDPAEYTRMVDQVCEQALRNYDACRDLPFPVYQKSTPKRRMVKRDELARNKSARSAALPASIDQKVRRSQSALIPPEKAICQPMAVTTTTPDQRITGLLAEGARLLAEKPGQPGINVTHDIVGLLESRRGAPDRLECAGGPAEDR